MRGITRILDLHAKSERRPGSDCWHWLGAMSGKPASPRIWAFCHDQGEKRVMSGPRAVFNIANHAGLGQRLAYMRCVNSCCVNPAHVASATTRAEIGANVAASGKLKGTIYDARCRSLERARAAQGMVVTTPEQVRAIRAAVGTLAQIGASVGCSPSQASRIRRGEARRGVA